MLNFYRKYCPYFATSILVAAILYLTLAPQPLPDTGIKPFFGADKIVHAAMFAFLAWLAMLDTSFRRPLSLRMAWIIAIAAALFGGLTELLQGSMGVGRTAELADFIADTVGALLAVPLRPRK